MDFFRKTKIWNRQLWRHDMTVMEQVVTRENPICELMIDDWWTMLLLHLDGIRNPEIQPSLPQFFVCYTKNTEKPLRTNWEDKFSPSSPALQIGGAKRSDFSEANPWPPESLHVPGPPTLGSGNCLSGRVDLGEVMLKGLKIVRWWGWYYRLINVQKRAGSWWFFLRWDSGFESIFTYSSFFNCATVYGDQDVFLKKYQRFCLEV